MIRQSLGLVTCEYDVPGQLPSPSMPSSSASYPIPPSNQVLDMFAAGGSTFPSQEHVVDPSYHGGGTDGGQYFKQVVEAVIASPNDSTAAPMGSVFHAKASYGGPPPAPYTPALSAISFSPPSSSVGTTSFDCPTPALTTADTLSGTDQSMVLYDGSEAASDPVHQTMSVVEESVLSKAFRAATASIIPSLLTGETAGYTPPPTPRPSRKQLAPHASSHRKHVSSTSQRVRVPPEKRNTKPRNIQVDIGEDPGSLVYARAGERLLCPTPGCTRTSARKSDMDRHMETHRAKKNQKIHVCCGVPVEQAAAYGIEDVSGQYLWEGLWMVGGCQRGFTRKDSLRRHMKIKPCRGDANLSSRLLGMMQGAASAGQTMEDSEDD